MKSLTRSLLLALALTTGAWVPVQAQTFGQSVTAYKHKDYRTAFAGFQKPAEHGDAVAQYFLGRMYGTGQGVLKNEQQAVAWYHKAAEQGDTDAQFSLGAMYYIGGEGVPRDDQSAYFWWLLANAQGDQDAAKWRDLVKLDLSPAQRANAQAEARVWKPK
jgi:TPR repeat protein